MLQRREVTVLVLVSDTVLEITVSVDWSYLFRLPIEDNSMPN